MYLEYENDSRKMQRIRHLIYSCAANKSGTMIQMSIQDYILFKYTVYLAPSSVKLWVCALPGWTALT